MTVAPNLMITFTPIKNGKLWIGSDWTIEDEDELASLVARVALGQYEHVLNVLEKTNCVAYAPAPTALKGATKLLTAKNPEEPWHRDGWLFQVVSWIAANLHDPASLKTPPQIRHADKGFDGLHVCLDSTDENVVSVVICEEKASDAPRGKITSQVWPDFKSMDTGERDHELVAETSTLLKANGHIDPSRAVHEILWKQTRAYRVSVTIGDNENSDSGRNALFSGYKKKVIGDDVERRRAETFYQRNMRAWMKRIADKAIIIAEEMVAEDV